MSGNRTFVLIYSFYYFYIGEIVNFYKNKSQPYSCWAWFGILGGQGWGDWFLLQHSSSNAFVLCFMWELTKWKYSNNIFQKTCVRSMSGVSKVINIWSGNWIMDLIMHFTVSNTIPPPSFPHFPQPKGGYIYIYIELKTLEWNIQISCRIINLKIKVMWKTSNI